MICRIKGSKGQLCLPQRLPVAVPLQKNRFHAGQRGPLDPDGEYALNQAIASYAEDRTVIFISHRLSSTRLADRIYMFADGVLAECGTHEELMQANGKYAYMFRLQAEKYAKTSS